MRLLVSGCSATVGRLAPLYPAELGTLLVPGAGNAPAAFGLPWAADNGAFSGLDAPAFRAMLRRLAGVPGCLFVAVPDAVGDAARTLDLWRGWRDEARDLSGGQPLGFVGQDGAEREGVPWGECRAYFVGGTTAWKLSPASAALVAEAKRRGLHAHMGRVNSRRRLRAAFDMGCDSADGSSLSKFGDLYIERFCRLARALRGQPALF